MTSRTFTNAPSSVSAARRFALDEIGEVSRPVREAVAIGVSELATNCVRYAGTDFSVDVDRTPERLRVEVTDFGGGVPTVRSPSASEPTGRGLLLVGALSDEWGITAAADGRGKSVWFNILVSMESSRIP